MAERKSEIMRWLDTIEGDPLIGIDEGGLTLSTANASYWLEVGGVPDIVEYTIEDWIEDVRQGNTLLGFHDWVDHQLESDGYDPKDDDDDDDDNPLF